MKITLFSFLIGMLSLTFFNERCVLAQGYAPATGTYTQESIQQLQQQEQQLLEQLQGLPERPPSC